MKKVTVVGLGYVGLPTAVHAGESGYIVSGFDLDKDKIISLNNGKSYIEDISNQRISNLLDKNLLKVFNKIEDIDSTDVFLVCVPTPLSSDRNPDLSYLEAASSAVSKVLKPGGLVIIESTVEPGTVRNFVIPILVKGSKLKLDDFLVAYSPERIDPGNQHWNLSNVPKLVSGFNSEALEKAISFYRLFVGNLFNCSSLEIAETAKLLENSFRFINISFVNELSMFCSKIGIEINEVISAAATKPYGFMPFYPGVGIGGHCIPVDPIYLSAKSKEIGAPSRFIDLADDINKNMPEYFVSKAEKKLGGIKGKKILVIGVAYKPNVADTRESPVKSLILGLRSKGATVFWHDELVKQWNFESSVGLENGYDLAILATPHSGIDLSKIGNTPFIDTRKSV